LQELYGDRLPNPEHVILAALARTLTLVISNALATVSVKLLGMKDILKDVRRCLAMLVLGAISAL